MVAALTGALFAFGVLILLEGLFPKKADLGTRLAVFNEESSGLAIAVPESPLVAYAMSLLVLVKGDKLEQYESDVEVVGDTMEKMAVEKLKTAAAAAAMLGLAGVFFGYIASPLALLIAAAVGVLIGYNVPDLELKKKAAARRLEFSRALTAFMTLLTSSIAGGGGIGTALKDSAQMGSGWVFDHITSTLDDAQLSGMSPWIALEKLGARLQIDPLIELAASLTLAGASGARITETLAARAEASRAKELADVRGAAEARSAKLGAPVGMLMLAFGGFIAFPAILTLAELT